MCQQIVTFCAGVQQPLLYLGSLIGALVSVALVYFTHETSELFLGEKSLESQLICGVGVYFLLVSIFVSFAAYRDQKWPTQTLSIASILSLILAASVFFVAYQNKHGLDGSKLRPLFIDPLKNKTPSSPLLEVLSKYNCCTYDGIQPDDKVDKFPAPCCSPSTSETKSNAPQNLSTNATTTTTTTTPPPSNKPAPECSELGKSVKHCKCVLEEKLDYQSYAGAALALISLYILLISGLFTLKTYRYDEAEQNAYT